MPFTSTDLAAVDAAIASGELRVRFDDGRQVEYRSVSELLEAKRLIHADLDAAAGVRRPCAFRINTEKGV